MVQEEVTQAELHRFHAARAAFRAYLITKIELEWRVRRLLPGQDKFRKAVEQLVWTSGVSHFQSCADDCAARFGASSPGATFPGFDSFMDVFYGNAQQVDTRVPEWSRNLLVQLSPPKRRKRGVKNTPRPRPTLLDRALLRDTGCYALAFMTAVRALPGFKKKWENKTVSSPVATFVAENGGLSAKESGFRRNFAKAERALDETPLCAQDVCDVALVLGRVLRSQLATRVVLRFVGKCPGDG